MFTFLIKGAIDENLLSDRIESAPGDAKRRAQRAGEHKREEHREQERRGPVPSDQNTVNRVGCRGVCVCLCLCLCLKHNTHGANNYK